MNAIVEATNIDVSSVRMYVDDLIAASISQTRIAVESGVPLAHLKSWINGKDDPETLAKLEVWKQETEAAATLNNGFVMTNTAQRIIRAFDRARMPQGGAYAQGKEIQTRGIALAFGASGAGKTQTAEWYLHTQNAKRKMGQWPVVMVRCVGDEKSLHAWFGKIIDSMKGDGFYLQAHESRIETIKSHVPAGGLIIFDDAQLLSPRRMDQLRYFPDQCGIAIAFAGNLAGYKNIIDAKIAQITSRVGGSCVVIDHPSEEDVDALLDAWEIRGRKVRERSILIGTQDGGLRVLSKIVKTAKRYAQASGKPIDIDMFNAAMLADSNGVAL